MNTSRTSNQRLTRRGRKLTAQSDDRKTVASLPKDVPERLWNEVLSREELDLYILDIREEIIERALEECYRLYMERQSISYTVDCLAKALLRIIDLQYYRHDPGEDPSVYPRVDVPSRMVSWVPDMLPDPSPKDTWSKVITPAVYHPPGSSIASNFSNQSIDLPVIDEIPPECRFPGKVRLFGYKMEGELHMESLDASETVSGKGGGSADVEILERVTDYDTADPTPTMSSSSESVNTEDCSDSCLKELCKQKKECGCKDMYTESKGRMPEQPLKSPLEKGLKANMGAGDATSNPASTKRKKHGPSSLSYGSKGSKTRAGGLPPIRGSGYPPPPSLKKSSETVFTELRSRNLRVETLIEVGSEHVEVDKP